MRIKFIQKLIDKIRHKEDLSVLNHPHIQELGTKFLSYKSGVKNIDTLILGSSHAQLGYRAKENEFNFGLSFQDLYYSYELYEKLNNKNLKNIIIFYSVFSAGNQTVMTKFADVAAVYKTIIGIDYQNKKAAKEKSLYKKERAYRKYYKKFKKEFVVDDLYRGNETSYITCFKPPIAADRAKSHYKNNQRNNNQTKYIEYLKNEVIKNNQNLFVVLSPVTQGYKAALPSSEELFKELYNVEGLCILNYYDKPFESEDFVDWDHLNINGANKLTEMIKSDIEKFLIKKRR